MTTAAQVAALPYRHRRDGALEILLVTSRDTRRWVLPKGWHKPQHAPSAMAGIEAWEEAGVRGEIATVAIGSFTYAKRKADALIPVVVAVFPLAVTSTADEWPEQGERTRCWFSVAAAAESVDEPGLKALLLSLAEPAGLEAKEYAACLPPPPTTPRSTSPSPIASRISDWIGRISSTR